MRLVFSVPGIPQAKQRARVNALLLCKRCGRKTMQKLCPVCGTDSDMTYLTNIAMTPKETANYESLVALCAREALNGTTEAIGSGAVRIRVTFRFPIPKSRARKLAAGQPHTQRPDLDNCLKSIKDGLNGVAWNDDCCVVSIVANKEWSVTGSAEIEVESIDQTGR